MRTSTLRVLALVMLPGLANAASFTPLGDLADGVFESGATGISADGAIVVGYGSTGSTGYSSFRWTPLTGMQDLSADIGSGTSFAGGISANGEHIVGATQISNVTYAYALHTDGTVHYLNGSADGYRAATAVSDDGRLVYGGFSSSQYDSPRAGVWLPYSAEVSDLTPSLGGHAQDASSDGQVVVGNTEDVNGIGQATVWRQFDGTRYHPTLLGSLREDQGQSESLSIALAVSDDGRFVVGSANSDLSGGEAFIWTEETGMTGLGMPEGYLGSTAYDVSGDGSVVVGDASGDTPVGPAFTAFIWTEDNGMQELMDFLVTRGAIGLEGWQLASARGLSSDGNWVVGTGINPDGNFEAFLANISPVPLPPAVWLFGSAIGLMGWMRRKAIA